MSSLSAEDCALVQLTTGDNSGNKDNGDNALGALATALEENGQNSVIEIMELAGEKLRRDHSTQMHTQNYITDEELFLRMKGSS